MKRRLLSILLMCCMVLTLLPTAALAEEPAPTFDLTKDLANIKIPNDLVTCICTTANESRSYGQLPGGFSASVVTKDVPKEMVVFGNPAKPHGSVRDIKDSEGQSAYPWRFHFERGMPWEGIGYEMWKEQN